MGYAAEKGDQYGRFSVRADFDTDIARVESGRNSGANNGRVAWDAGSAKWN
jgi:hypothetical protein